MFPQLLQLGSFSLHSYGLLVAAAFLVGLLLASRLAHRSGLDPDLVANLGIYVAVAAILGAKLFLLLGDISYYASNPGQIFSMATLQAGGVFYGGLLAALATAIWRLRRAGLPALRTADCFAAPLALGHATGRVGCFLAGCCWGKPSKLPWAVTFISPVAREVVGVPLHISLHPTQLYESAAELIFFAVLWRRFHRPHRDGAIVGLYLALYSIFRFGVEFLRDPANLSFPIAGPLSSTQWMALAVAAAGTYLAARRSTA